MRKGNPNGLLDETHHRQQLTNLEGDELEKRVYDSLKTFFEGDQQVLVLHGHEFMDLSMPENDKKVIYQGVMSTFRVQLDLFKDVTKGKFLMQPLRWIGIGLRHLKI